MLIQRPRLETRLQLFIEEIRKPVRILAGGPPVGLAPDLVHVDAHVAVSDRLQRSVPLMLVRIDADVIQHFRVEPLQTHNLHQSAVERAQRIGVVVRVQAERKFARGVQIGRIILVCLAPLNEWRRAEMTIKKVTEGHRSSLRPSI
ncbi:hypothetical protein [Paraburkholderia sp. BL6665CI2N2]|uniref:hypothetical protein n=1 Tax=Paraburkholderia sp. BL6665CI2N2 TaxID=1938806 RepID=UPI001FB95696|nr:hypothetical protein [Paraburkholderia sp. BL6665CI2N2]